MFIGHYAVSLAARRAEPGAPLWAYVAAAQLLDILWCLFIMAGIERVVAAPHLTEGLRFIDYPWSHSLAAAFVWAGVTTQVARRAFRVSPRTATALGLTVLSHWLLDFIVHRPDLPLAPDVGPELGLGLWQYAGFELAVEILLLLGAGAALLARWHRHGHRIGPLAAFILFGAVAFVAMRSAPPPSEADPVMLGAVGLALYLGFVLLAWLAERFSMQEGR